MLNEISKNEILQFQEKWGIALVQVGTLFTQKKEYKNAAVDLIKQFYGYDEGTVLFKPTRAQHDQFRLSAEAGLAYFIGDNKNFEEDSGFALQPWTNVRFENCGFIFNGTKAIAMGNYYFTDLDGNEKQVEYSIGVFRTSTGSLKINLHHSSLPYLHPKHETKTSIK